MRVCLKKKSSEGVRNRKPYHRVSKTLRAEKLLAAGKVSIFYFGKHRVEFNVNSLDGVSDNIHLVSYDGLKMLWDCTCDAYINWNEPVCTHIVACKKFLEGKK